MTIQEAVYMALLYSERRYYRWQANMDKRSLKNKAHAIAIYDRVLISKTKEAEAAKKVNDMSPIEQFVYVSLMQAVLAKESKQ